MALFFRHWQLATASCLSIICVLLYFMKRQMTAKFLKNILHFFSFKVNRRILMAFFLIITIPWLVSYGVSNYIISKTVEKEIETRLSEGVSVYLEELESIEQKCISIASGYSKKERIVEQIRDKNYGELENEMVEFYKLDIVDIIEIENSQGRVIFRGHNPEKAGDIKIDQQVILEALNGKTSVSYEEGNSGVAVRAAAPILSDNEVIGIFMAGDLFSQDFVTHLKNLTLLENGIYRGRQKIISTFLGLENLNQSTLEKLQKGESLVQFNQDLANTMFHIIAAPIFLRETYWGAVVLGVEKNEIEKAYTYTNRLLTYIVLLSLFIAVLIYYYLARNINSSLKKIISGISSFSFDHPNKPIEMKRSDEFGIIADNYNILVDRIELYKQRIHRLQNELVESTRLATAGQVAAGLAHEIRNPLSSIKMMAQIIEKRHLKEEAGEEEMKIILEEIDRINNRVTELLEFSKPSKMDFLYHDLHSIIEGVLKLCRYDIERKNIILEKNFDRSMPELYADGEKLRICILNIILNAIQAMERGGNLRIDTHKTDEMVIVKIKNSGSRLDADRIDALFEPFYSTKQTGTGLGLSIAKLVIERHGGSINVKKGENMVSFSIELPLHSTGDAIHHASNIGDR